MNEQGPLVLVIEPDAGLRRTFRTLFRAQGFRLAEASSARDGLACAARLRPDLVLLGSDPDGMNMVRNLRTTSTIPIVMASAPGRESDQIEALDLGVDDFLTRPFVAGELLARIRARLRRLAQAWPDAPLQIGALTLDLDGHVITLGGLEVHLTPSEFALLGALASNPGRVLTHKELIQVLATSVAQDKATGLLRMHMANLRKKLLRGAAGSELVLTEPGVGYRLRARQGQPKA